MGDLARLQGPVRDVNAEHEQQMTRLEYQNEMPKAMLDRLVTRKEGER